MVLVGHRTSNNRDTHTHHVTLTLKESRQAFPHDCPWGCVGGVFPTLWISLDGFPNFLKKHHGKTEHNKIEHTVFYGRHQILRINDKA